jgi:hypothetical protein
MTDNDYLKMLLTGLVNHPDFLSNHIYRECIKAKELHIEEDEFYSRCHNIITWLNSKFDERLYERKYELYMVIDLTKNEKATSINIKKPTQSKEERAEDIIMECTNELNSLSRYNFTIYLSLLGQNIYYDSVVLMEKAIVEAENKYILAHNKVIFKSIHSLLETLQTKDENKSLSVKQVALIHSFENWPITRENSTEIAKKYGYKSGEGLYQDYNLFHNTLRRRAIPDNPTKTLMKNKITLFESVLPHLSNLAMARALDEINILKTQYSSEFE